MTHHLSRTQICLFGRPVVPRCHPRLLPRLNEILCWLSLLVGAFVATIGEAFADGRIGIELRNDYNNKGALISKIIEGSPADDAELRTGSWISHVDGQPIQTQEQFLAITAKKKLGDKLRLSITFKDGSTASIDVALVDRATVFRKRELTADERDAIQELNDVGAKLDYDYDRPAKPIVTVELDSYNITDDTIHCLSYVRTVQHLKIRAGTKTSPKFTGKTFGELSRCPKLRSIEFVGNLHQEPVVQAKLLDSLATVPQLKSVTILNENLSDASIQSLSQFQQLEELSLRFVPISDSAMEHIGKLKQLKKLDLCRARITGKSLTFIKEMKNLAYLDLDAIPVQYGQKPSDLPKKIQNDDLIHLSGLEQLETLDLSNSEVTDQGLMHLRPLKKLKFLGLNNAGIIKADGTIGKPVLSDETENLDPVADSVLRSKLEDLDDGRERPKEKTGITTEGLLENFKQCPLTELEVKGIEFENKEVRQMQKVWPKARITMSRKVVFPAPAKK